MRALSEKRDTMSTAKVANVRQVLRVDGGVTRFKSAAMRQDIDQYFDLAYLVFVAVTPRNVEDPITSSADIRS